MPLQTNFIENLISTVSFKITHMEATALPFDVKTVLNLCGGIPCPGTTGINVTIHATYHSAFSIQVITDQYEAVRNIGFSIGRIDNNYLHVNERRQGLGTNLFLNQFQTARALGFKRIHLTAMAPTEDAAWEGYYFWANLGFENRETAEFENWAKSRRRKERTLSELMQTEEGRAIWKEAGFTWIGDFFLHDQSPCIEHLMSYLARKDIEVVL